MTLDTVVTVFTAPTWVGGASGEDSAPSDVREKAAPEDITSREPGRR